jgi:predicted small secreted protein
MKLKTVLCAMIVLCALTLAGCQSEVSKSGAGNLNQNQSAPPQQKGPAALPETGFRAQIILVAPPANLRAGQKETIRVKVRNASDVQWYARGGEINTNPDNRFYLAAGNRWLKPDGSLITSMDGRYGLPGDLKPFEEVEVPLQISAPKEPGKYLLEVDLVQEQVAWFSDKGSPTARTEITVAR